MNLKISLPYQVFAEKTDVIRIVAESRDGWFGILPHRLDCVTALVPGILNYETLAEGEVYIAIDEGILVKTGQDVFISVRRALAGSNLDELHDKVDAEFLLQDGQQQQVRSVLAKLESGFIQGFSRIQHE